MNPGRITILRDGEPGTGPVVYWMQRDQRVDDNWALIHAQRQAVERRTSLLVIFCLVPQFLDAALRQYAFLIGGLREVERGLRRKNIPFRLLTGAPAREIPRALAELQAGTLVTDFNPIRTVTEWKRDVAARISIPFLEIDAHNIVPCRVGSPKLEFAAYTLRPKIRKMLEEYLTPFPVLRRQAPGSIRLVDTDWDGVRAVLRVNQRVVPVDWLEPGENAARRALRRFIEHGLDRYEQERNDPVADAQSNLSPYIHFGHVSAQRVALDVRSSAGDPAACDAFLEELIVRRELSDNFCHYNRQYDSFDGFPPWAQATLDAHRKDKRSHLYGMEEFESAATHDRLWNAAQRQMTRSGKMHGYMRMYWAKKILEWTSSPEEALRIAIWLNDTYELDGRDPNGYAGIAWSIGGVHDRAWPERPVFGKIRYMNEAGCRRKFDVESYIRRWM